MFKQSLKAFLILVLAAVFCSSRSTSDPLHPDGTYRGRKLMGKVYTVMDPLDKYDFGVFVCETPRQVDTYLKVCWVEGKQFLRPGEWESVNKREDADFVVCPVWDVTREVLGIEPDFCIYFVDDYRQAGVVYCGKSINP